MKHSINIHLNAFTEDLNVERIRKDEKTDETKILKEEGRRMQRFSADS